MISKYDGICKGCKTPYAKGEDIFWANREGAWHWLCRESQPASTEAERVADELGFQTREYWDVFFLPPCANGDTAWWNRSEASERDTLRDVPTGDTCSINDVRGKQSY